LKLPTEYQPFNELTLCSNRMRGVKMPLVVDGSPVLLIGRGAAPLVWIAAPAPSKTWNFVVEGSVSKVQRVSVTVDQLQREVTVRAGPLVVLHVRAENDESAVVDSVDLRPIWLLFFGDESELHVGPTRLARNFFDGIESALVFGSSASSTAQ
jgi:hypothetical protein